MENLLDIEDYSVSQTTLDQVFTFFIYSIFKENFLLKLISG